MAGLWNGTALNSNVQASVFNQLYNIKAIEQVRHENGLLYAVLGKSWGTANDQSKIGAKFERLERVSGLQIEMRILGALNQVTAVADGSAELALATPTWQDDYFGGNTFDLTHFADTQGIPSDEYVRIQGDEAKTLSYMDDVFGMIALSLENTIGNGLGGANASTGVAADTAPSRTTLGSWGYAVSDGVSSGETGNAQYGEITRSDVGNVDYRSYVSAGVGELTTAAIRYVKLQNKTHGGNNKIGIAGLAVYNKLMGILESVSVASNDADWLEFGGEYIAYGGTRYILDQRSPTGVLGLLDPSSWVFYQNEMNFTETGFIKAPHLKSGYVMPWECWVQLLCKQPSRNGKLTGINA